MRVLSLMVMVGLAAACGASNKSAGGASAAPSGSSFESDGLSVSRPGDWSFVAADASVAPDTLIVLQGPLGNDTLAPVVEISRRSLSAQDQRRKPAHVLTAMVTEIAQSFEGFEGATAPEDVQVAGHPGARLTMKFSESLPDGTSVQRAARFYGIVFGGNIWLVRCLGPTDGSADGAFDEVVASLKLE